MRSQPPWVPQLVYVYLKKSCHIHCPLLLFRLRFRQPNRQFKVPKESKNYNLCHQLYNKFHNHNCKAHIWYLKGWFWLHWIIWGTLAGFLNKIWCEQNFNWTRQRFKIQQKKMNGENFTFFHCYMFIKASAIKTHGPKLYQRLYTMRFKWKWPFCYHTEFEWKKFFFKDYPKFFFSNPIKIWWTVAFFACKFHGCSYHLEI